MRRDQGALNSIVRVPIDQRQENNENGQMTLGHVTKTAQLL